MVHLTVRMHCSWPTDHPIDHSSIGLNRLTIQQVFNEVSLFTFSEGTHGFDVTVPKSYLKRSSEASRWQTSVCYENEATYEIIQDIWLRELTGLSITVVNLFLAIFWKKLIISNNLFVWQYFKICYRTTVGKKWQKYLGSKYYCS